MDESELTRKAIEEIMREMDAGKEADNLPQIRERKLNPLGRPNKDFLDRTINSVMTHNKRQLERNHRKCQSKLRDMDEAGKQPKRQGRERYRTQRKMKRRRRRSESTTSLSSKRDSSSSKERKTKHKKNKKKKRRSKKARSKSSSSTSSSSISIDTSFSSSSSGSSNKSNRKRRKPKDENFEADYEKDEFYHHQGEPLDPTTLGYYVDPNMALAAMAYSHMNQMLQQQQQQSMQDLVKEELENIENDDNSVDIPSDLSLTYHSESELNISLNSSSAEEDENGVLTFKLTSDEEQMNNKTSTKLLRKRKLPTKPRGKWSKSKNCNENESTLVGTSSGANKTFNKKPIVDEEITVISSSSCSDTEHREEITTILSSSSSSSETDNDETVTKQEEITILSSCTSSTDTDEEDANKKNQEENDTTMFNQDKELETQKEASESILGSSGLTILDNEEVEYVINQSSQKQVEETTSILDLNSSTNLKLDVPEMLLNETINSALKKKQEELTANQLSGNKTQEESNTSLHLDSIEEHCDIKKSEPTNDEPSFVENQDESTTVLSKSEQNTKDKETTFLINSLSTIVEIEDASCAKPNSDSEVIEMPRNETQREIRLSAAGQEETCISGITKDLEHKAAKEKSSEITLHIITEKNNTTEEEIIATKTKENANVLEVKEKEPKSNDNVIDLQEKNKEVLRIVFTEEKKDVITNDNNVKDHNNIVLLNVTDG